MSKGAAHYTLEHVNNLGVVWFAHSPAHAPPPSVLRADENLARPRMWLHRRRLSPIPPQCCGPIDEEHHNRAYRGAQ